jgi:hypothetical protein
MTKIRRVFRIAKNRRGGSYVTSAVILAAVSIALGLIVLSWAQSRSSDYTEQYGDALSADAAKMKERLATEYVVYDGDAIRIYLLNWGTIDDVEIQTVHVRNSTWHIAVSTPALRFLDDTEIPDQDLDMGEEGYLAIEYGHLKIKGYYYVRILTVRGALFDSTFVA